MMQKKLSNVLIFFGCIFFLYYLPSIEYFGEDYVHYFGAYEASVKIPGYPWVQSQSSIDAEPFYLWYNAMVSVYSGLSFSFFMALNYALCVLISHFMLRSFSDYYRRFFWIMIIPVIFITIFYALLRSSMSYFLVGLGFFSLLQPNKIKAVLLCLLFVFMGINMHSQYILISLLFIGGYFILRFNSVKDYHFNFKFIVITAVLLVGVLYSFKSFIDQIASVLSFLPSSGIASSKIGYLIAEDNRNFRITAILSVIVYPAMMYNVLKKMYWTDKVFILNDKLKERKFLFLFFMIICYGAAINIAYIDSPHVASRLARFSDYLGMAVLMPIYFKTCIGNKAQYFALALIIILAPIIYPAVYHNVEWNIF